MERNYTIINGKVVNEDLLYSVISSLHRNNKSSFPQDIMPIYNNLKDKDLPRINTRDIKKWRDK